MFDEFYAMYPRKKSPKDALKAWNSLKSDERLRALQALPHHIEYWKASCTEKQWIPYPASWLRAGAFDDEVEMPEVKSPVEKAWWTSEAGILEYGRQKGVPPKVGELMSSYKQRLTGLSRTG